MAQLQSLAMMEDPLLIRMEGQQLPAVHVQRSIEGVSVTRRHGVGGQPIEHLDIGLEICARKERDRFPADLDAPAGIRRLADEMRSLVQPVGDRGEGRVRPEPIEDLFTMHAVGGRESEQLDELGRITTAEARPVDQASVDDDLESSQQPHFDTHGGGA